MRCKRSHTVVSSTLLSFLALAVVSMGCAPGIDSSTACSLAPSTPGCTTGSTTQAGGSQSAIDAGTVATGTGTTTVGNNADAGASGSAGDAGAEVGGGSASTDAGGTASTGTTTTPSALTTYTAYTGTDYKPIPTAPALGPANYQFKDPTFGARMLRVTDENTHNGQSMIPTDAGFHRTFNADSTSIKLTGPDGSGYWLEFNASSFTVGDGSSKPAIHTMPFAATWEWSAVDPNAIFYLHGSKIAQYNKSTGATTDINGPSNGDPAVYDAVVIGKDKWVCSVAGAGGQNAYTKLYCVQPSNPSNFKFIDLLAKTINGVVQTDPNWPTSAAGQTLGIHSISSSTGSSWLEVDFHQQSWGGDGDAVFNLDTNTWSLVTNADYYWSGHLFMGNGRYVNGSGSKAGTDSRGMVIRDPNSLMNESEYQFIAQPPTPTNDWCDGEHSSWFNSMDNASAPILQSRYNIAAPSQCQFAWSGEITVDATDGSNTVWRFAHNHNSGQSCYYGEAFAQISADGKWALFSSPWDGALGTATGGGNFDCATRVDTFLVELK